MRERMEQTQTQPVRILLVDGPSLFRQAVGGALDGEHDLHVVAETQDPLEAVEQMGQINPDVVLLDADLMDAELASTVRRMKASSADCKVFVLTSDEPTPLLVEALEAGASGYLTKDASIAQLIQATRSVSHGEVVIPPRMVGTLLAMLLSQRDRQDESLTQLSKLTRREREVLALLADGSDKNAIARALVISPQTARTHVQNILAKLGFHSRLEAAAFARRLPVLQELGRS